MRKEFNVQTLIYCYSSCFVSPARTYTHKKLLKARTFSYKCTLSVRLIPSHTRNKQKIMCAFLHFQREREKKRVATHSQAINNPATMNKKEESVMCVMIEPILCK
jgi:hypothetical protein